MRHFQSILEVGTEMMKYFYETLAEIKSQLYVVISYIYCLSVLFSNFKGEIAVIMNAHFLLEITPQTKLNFLFILLRQICPKSRKKYKTNTEETNSLFITSFKCINFHIVVFTTFFSPFVFFC